MTIRNIKIQNILNLLPYVFVFFASLYHPVDSDLGWHLKYGEYFFNNHQVLRENIFSVEMPNYHWPNSSWLTDLVTYSIFANFGFLGLSILGAIVVTATFFLFSRAFKLSFFDECLIFPPLVFLLLPVNSISFRGQLLSLLLIGLVFYLLRLYEKNRSKIIYSLPFVFLIWANLHGQFLLGLGLFALWIITWSLKEFFFETERRQEIVRVSSILILIFVLSAIAALLNPFGIEIYKEALRHFGNPLQKQILEWLPFDQRSGNWLAQITAGIVMFFGAIYLFFSDKFKEKMHLISIALVFFILTFWIRRYAWPMYYLSIVLLVPVAQFFKPESKRATEILATSILMLSLIFTFITFNPLGRIRNMSWQKYCEFSTKCSSAAISFLIENNLQNNLLTVYDWGGWMIWNWPQIKPTIDGRMHLWRDETGYSAFESFYRLEQNIDDINESKYKVVLMTSRKPLYSKLKGLSEKGDWKLEYEDEFSGVFVKKGKN